jgi:serine/threonine protein kinase
MDLSDPIMSEFNQSLEEHGYELVSRIGSGAFGVVYKITSRRYVDQEFVVKVIFSPQEDAPSIDNTEFEVLLRLSHPNILHLYSQWRTKHCLCIILEYAPNGSLQNMLTSSGPLDKVSFWSIAHQSLQALAYVHSRNIFHADIKPGNILLDAHFRVKLADFGMAERMTKRDSLQIKGSLPYMSPELVRGISMNGFANDIWALGITFFQLATGRVPWQSKHKGGLHREIVEGLIVFPVDLDGRISSMLQRMLDAKPEWRATAEQLLQLPTFELVLDGRRRSGSSLAVAGASTLGLKSSASQRRQRMLGGPITQTIARKLSAFTVKPTLPLLPGEVDRNVS